jgi:hypothetical protein
MHGGRQELDAARRREAAQLVGLETERTNADIAHALDLAPCNTVESNRALPSGTVGHDLAPSGQTASSAQHGHLAARPEPESQGGLLPQKITSNTRLISRGGEGSENQTSKIESSPSEGGSVERHVLKIGGQPSDENQDPMYTIPDRTLKASFDKKLGHSGQMNLNQELALVRALIQQLVTKMNAKNLTAEELNKLDKLLMRGDKLLNTIMKVESTRKVQYTRESLRMDVMKVVQVIRKLIPEEDRRRVLATELAKVLGPSLAEPGDIIVSREVFKRG